MTLQEVGLPWTSGLPDFQASTTELSGGSTCWSSQSMGVRRMFSSRTHAQSRTVVAISPMEVSIGPTRQGHVHDNQDQQRGERFLLRCAWEKLLLGMHANTAKIRLSNSISLSLSVSLTLLQPDFVIEWYSSIPSKLRCCIYLSTVVPVSANGCQRI